MAMTKPLDATMRELYEVEPAAWLEFLGIPVPDPGLVAVIDSNLSTVTADSDKLIRRDGPDPLILHTEFLSGRVVSYPRQLHRYNALAGYKHGAPVWSVLFLLRPAADGPELTGEYVQEVPGRGANLWFRYEVVRVWELPPERLLTAGLPLVPLAPVSAVPRERLPEVLAAVARRLRDEAAAGLKGALWAATEILLGLNHPKDRVKELTEEITTMVLGIRGIEESSVYQDIFAKGEAKGRAEGEAKGRAEGEAKGRAAEARKILLRQGRKRLGPPEESVQDRIAALSDVDRLDLLLDRLLDVASWDELLASAES
jgi:predicted transposase YdaD